MTTVVPSHVNSRTDSTVAGKEIFRSLVEDLDRAQVNIASTATPRRYRLVDCREYVSHGRLSIREFSHMSSPSSIPYAAISYIWKGNRTPPEDNEEQSTPSFTVVGVGTDGDPVSISVLHEACCAALAENVHWLWLDCLCIMQTDRDDKSWQIQHMYAIYRDCQVSIVLPGGLARLVPVDEETRWITRAWTLQEVVAPPKVIALFSWTLGSGRWEGWEGGVGGDVTEVSAGVSAKMPLDQLLKACHHPVALTWTPHDNSKASLDDISPSILGDYGDPGVGALMWALQVSGPEEQAMALWQASILRASSRPVDMVFSIMGAFGVNLDPKDFHKNDRISATIALAQGILRQGGKPVWLGLSLDIRPSPYISSFSDFPITDVDGTVHWSERRGPIQLNVPDDIYGDDVMYTTDDERQEAWEETHGEDVSSISLPQYYLTDLPSGTMDDTGYLAISTKAARIQPMGQVFGRRRTNLAHNNNHVTAAEFPDLPDGVVRVVGTDGRVWGIIPPDPTAGGEKTALLSSELRTYIIVIGKSKRFPLAPIWQPDTRPIGGIVLPDMSTIRACAVEEHRRGKFHRSSTFLLEETRFRPVIEGWPMISVEIGGPEELPGMCILYDRNLRG